MKMWNGSAKDLVIRGKDGQIKSSAPTITGHGADKSTVTHITSYKVYNQQ